MVVDVGGLLVVDGGLVVGKDGLVVVLGGVLVEVVDESVLWDRLLDDGVGGLLVGSTDDGGLMLEVWWLLWWSHRLLRSCRRQLWQLLSSASCLADSSRK